MVARIGNLQYFRCPPFEAYLPALARPGAAPHISKAGFEALKYVGGIGKHILNMALNKGWGGGGMI